MNEIIYKDLRQKGFTLIEVVLSIVIAGILVTMALRSVVTISETAKVEETKQEMEQLAYGIIGNPELENNGIRTDFGYVGNVGSLPPNLDALFSNPGGYSTWKSPYIKRRFSQITNDYKQDAWGINYSYSGGIDITSTGSGSNIVRKLANATSDLVINQITGTVLDLDGTSPGDIYKDSVILQLTIPDGAGNILTKTTNPNAGGYFSFDSIPISNHDLEIIYLPDNDSLKRFVSVLPNSSLYNEYFLGTNVWTAATSGGSSPTSSIVYVPGTAQTSTGNCNWMEFNILNMSDNPITVNSITLTWSSPTAYYKKVKWDGNNVFVNNNPRAGSGDVSAFSGPETINSGQEIQLRIEEFMDVPTGGGNKVDMSNIPMTVDFSDGSTINFNTGACN
ncbi:MAG: type II secretion system protein [Candidatus Zixiibacteriota bacterium]